MYGTCQLSVCTISLCMFMFYVLCVLYNRFFTAVLHMLTHTYSVVHSCCHGVLRTGSPVLLLKFKFLLLFPPCLPLVSCLLSKSVLYIYTYYIYVNMYVYM